MMNTKEYKLQLVKKILEIEDIQVLQMIGKIMDLHEQTGSGDLPAVLPSSKKTLSREAADLQKDIDEIFGQS